MKQRTEYSDESSDSTILEVIVKRGKRRKKVDKNHQIAKVGSHKEIQIVEDEETESMNNVEEREVENIETEEMETQNMEDSEEPEIQNMGDIDARGKQNTGNSVERETPNVEDIEERGTENMEDIKESLATDSTMVDDVAQETPLEDNQSTGRHSTGMEPNNKQKTSQNDSDSSNSDSPDNTRDKANMKIEPDDSNNGRVQAQYIGYSSAEDTSSSCDEFSEGQNESPAHVLIGNLPENVTANQIIKFFKANNIILSYVKLKKEFAEAVVPPGSLVKCYKLIGKLFNKKRISLVAIDREDEPEPPEHVSIIVKYLSPTTTEGTLKEAYPTAISAILILDKGQSKGYGFVNFKTRREAHEAIRSVQHVDGRTINSSLASSVTITLESSKPTK